MIAPQTSRDARTTYLGAHRGASDAPPAMANAPEWFVTVVDELKDCCETRFEAAAFMTSVTEASATGIDYERLELRYALTRLSGFDCSLRDALVGLRGERDDYVFSVQRLTRALVTKIEDFDECDLEVAGALENLRRDTPLEDKTLIDAEPLGVWVTRLSAKWHSALQNKRGQVGANGRIEALSAARQDLIAEMRFLAVEAMAA